ncbi:MAG TPA: thioredoxin domain-containing protein [Polyangia bacterium]|nr:thioredoxin domain-containing protein [Polyangia bacterium]
MRRASSLLLLVGVIGALLTAAACAKSPAEAHPAEASAVKTTGAPSGESTAPPGVDISKLDDFGKKVFFRIGNSEPSVCGQAQSLLASAKATRNGCARSVSALRYVVRLVDQGFTDSEVSEALAKRYRPVSPKQIDVSDAPMKGNPNARVTLVEFADYECPHCKNFQPVLHQILDEFPNDVKLYFKHYPLPQHTEARLAAEAAVAAQKQGKFWSFQDKLWEHQDELGPAEIEKVAKESGLDVAKFRQDVASSAVKAKVEKDHNQGSAIGLQATPTLYINGREYTDARNAESLSEWIKDALGTS